MASNRYALLIFITALCLTVPASLWAQSPGYYMEVRFVQRLTWVGDQYAMRYEVIIEKEEDGKYKSALREFTTASFIEVSLSPGKYRFQVIPHDFLDLPVPVTEWMDFEVQRGITQDQLDNYVPGEHEIIMVNPSEPESRRIVNVTSPKPAGEPENKNEIKVQIPERETIIEYINPYDIYVGLVWIPNLLFFGENESFGEKPSPYGIGLRLAIASAKQKLFKFGMEGIYSYHYSTGDQPVQSITFDLNVVMRFSNGSSGIFYRFGAGVSLDTGASSESVNGHANIGISFLLSLMKHLYLEAGLEYVQYFNNMGIVRPSVGLGYRF